MRQFSNGISITVLVVKWTCVEVSDSCSLFLKIIDLSGSFFFFNGILVLVVVVA